MSDPSISGPYGTNPTARGARYPHLGPSADPHHAHLEFAPTRSLRFRLPQLTPGTFHVYVVWSASDLTAVLYVGRSRSVLMRLGQHFSDGGPAWVADAGEIEVYEFATREAMIDGEIVLIDRHQPIHNEMLPDIRDGKFWAWRAR
jgi:hypothetical protein